MYKCFFLLLIAGFAFSKAFAQVVPAEGSQLHYRMIGFTDPGITAAKQGKLEIATGTHDNPDSFAKHIIATQNCKAGKVVFTVPYFGCEYTWRITHISGKDKAKSDLHHFTTRLIPHVDTTKMRLDVRVHARKYSGAYVFLDFNKVLYDMQGRALWFLPDIDGISFNEAVVRDLKLTESGTITLLINDMPYEIDYSGRVLWKGPNDGKVSLNGSEHYHHDFTKLKNGHYMVLGTENVYWEPGGQEPASNNFPTPGKRKSPFGTVIEYDKAGKVIWSWKSSTYYRNSTLDYERPPGGLYDIHQNAFFFDEKKRAVYVSFKNISQVVKVTYPEGAISATYDNGLFCQQHNCRSSPKGYLYLFNNNVCSESRVPEVVLLQEPLNNNGQLKIIWKFECLSTTTNGPIDKLNKLTSGGSVTELPWGSDGALFVSNCTPYADLFIVNRNKEILWHGVPQKWDAEGKKWFVLPQYRASIIEGKLQIEKAIWHK